MKQDSYYKIFEDVVLALLAMLGLKRGCPVAVKPFFRPLYWA